MPRSLFRKEAIDAQREKFLGEAIVAQPVRLWVYTLTACGIALIAIAVAVWGQYTRRERVQGYLSSAIGAADVRMPDAGTVTEILVREGDAVTAGMPMGRLAFDRSGVNDAKGNAAVLDQLSQQIESLTHERDQTARLGQQQLEQSQIRIDNLQAEIRASDGEIALQVERVGQSKALLDKWLELKLRDNFASDFYILQYQKELKDQQIKLQNLQRQRATIVRDLGAAQSERPSLRSRTATQLDQLDQKVSVARQDVGRQENDFGKTIKRDMVIVAPVDGVVTNIGPAPGRTVAADAHFATVLPKDSRLHAELLVPTRAIGFVKPGQAVTMRYDAFPYERFGQYGGKVQQVGKDIWTAGEAVGPLAVREPVYRIVVDLDRQDIVASEQRFPLRAGMVVSADLLMEKRTLLEWLFQPVLQLRQRIGASAPEASS